MGELRKDLPRDQWIDGRLFVHNYGFYIISPGRPWWLFFRPRWVIFQGGTTWDTEQLAAIPVMFFTLRHARRFVDETHQTVIRDLEKLMNCGG